MTLKPPLNLLFFVISWLGVYFILRFLSDPFTDYALLIIPLVFSSRHLIHSVISLFKRKFPNALLSFTIALLFALISLKIGYLYYNLLFAILILLLTIAVIKIFRNGNETPSDRYILLFLFLLNLVLTLTPDEQILKYRGSFRDVYWRNLTWDDFQGTPTYGEDTTAVAQINSGLTYSINRAYHHPRAVVLAYMNPKLSWHQQDSDFTFRKTIILLHEQGHFDIRELYRRKIYDSISSTSATSEPELKKLIKYWICESDSMEDKYDDFVDHGKDSLRQIAWSNLVHKALFNSKTLTPNVLKEQIKTSENKEYKRDLYFFAAVNKNLNKQIETINSLIHRFGELVQQYAGKKLLEDSIAKYYIRASFLAMLGIDTAIKNISTLNECDEKLQLKNCVLNYLNSSEVLFGRAFPFFIHIIRIGVENATPEEKDSIRNIKIHIGEFQLLDNELQNKSKAFSKEHHISLKRLDAAEKSVN